MPLDWCWSAGLTFSVLWGHFSEMIFGTGAKLATGSAWNLPLALLCHHLSQGTLCGLFSWILFPSIIKFCPIWKAHHYFDVWHAQLFTSQGKELTPCKSSLRGMSNSGQVLFRLNQPVPERKRGLKYKNGTCTWHKVQMIQKNILTQGTSSSTRPPPPSLSVLFPEQLEFFPEVFFLYKSVYLSHISAPPLPFFPPTNGSYNTHHSYLAFCTINKLDIIL